MAPEDEARFLDFVFERPSAWLIPDVRNPTSKVPRTRDTRSATSLHCTLWDSAISPEPESEHMPKQNDYYLRGGGALIQFSRCEVRGTCIFAGRIAWKASELEKDTPVVRATAAWFRQLARWLKAHCVNSFVYASDYQPEVGYRERTTWVGPQALARCREGWQLKLGPPEFSLRYFDPADELATLSAYRKLTTLIGEGCVAEVGEVRSHLLRKRVYRVVFESGLPFSEFEGAFSCLDRSEPKVGDAVACVFAENVTGRQPDPWQPEEIRKISPQRRERVLALLRKSYRL
jgi:hypothetical protein